MDFTGVQISKVSLLAKHCFTLLSCPACFLKKETVAHQKIRPALVLNFRLGRKKMAPPNVPTLDRVGFSFWQVRLSLSRRKAIWQPNVLPNFDTQFFFWLLECAPRARHLPHPLLFPQLWRPTPAPDARPTERWDLGRPSGLARPSHASCRFGSCPLGTGGTSGRASMVQWIFSSVKAWPVACRHAFVSCWPKHGPQKILS